ncbi:hypothetical protein BC826DRAFT_430856 [Russula brevipes]|nr:hypothetical protein BC826DRAFT_430856 [Russula brevipes]
MTNWQDPALVFAEYIALLKFGYVLAGLYIWEIVLNLDYEFATITGKRKFTWTFLLYLGCRWCPLVIYVLQFVGSDPSREVNCQALVTSTFVFSALSLLFASALMVLRIYAIWEFNKIVVALASASWSPICLLCRRCGHIPISIFSTFITDLVLLTLMLIGILRWRNVRKAGGILSLMYTQGIAWPVVFTLAEVPPVVFIILNLNDPMNLMFPDLGVMIMSIGTARMYRGLVKYPIRAADGVPLKEAGAGDSS